MATYISNQVDGWSTEAMWTPNGRPVSGDSVTLIHTVLINTADEAAGRIIVSDGGAINFVSYDYALAVDDDVIITGSGTLTGVNGALTVGGRFAAYQGSGLLTIATSWTIVGNFSAVGRRLSLGPLTVSGQAVVVGGSVTDIDASGGNRLAAYGSADGGGNTNVHFCTARGKRAMLLLNRRAYQTGLTP